LPPHSIYSAIDALGGPANTCKELEAPKKSQAQNLAASQ